MNIYLENAGVIKNCRYVKKISHLLAFKERIDLFLQSDKRITLLEQMLIVMCVPTIKTIRLTIHTSKLLPELVWFSNHFSRYSLQFVVDKPLSANKWKRICRLKDVIYINDISKTNHTHLYQADRRVIYGCSSCDILHTANTYYVATKMPIKQCEFSSCLGKTLYIAKDGSVSFCSAHPKNTYMGKVGELTELFHTPQFAEALNVMIARRGKCSTSCIHYQGCMGGCVFWQDCTAFRQDCDLAVTDISNLIESRCDLSELPIYKERSIVYRLFSRKTYPNSIK